ncbi:MAG: PLP-dependent aminotransferase family protein [Anaerolineales bacterium]
MSRPNRTFQIGLVHLNTAADVPLYQQLYDALRIAILDGRLARHTRLPSSRDLADLLDVSRTTVMNAYDQLIAEGYLEPRRGSGTYVSAHLPADLLQARRVAQARPPDARGERPIAKRAATITDLPHGTVRMGRALPFRYGAADMTRFPVEVWARLTAIRQRYPQRDHFTYHAGSAGYAPLRAAIAAYLASSRGVVCHPDHIIITSGAQQGIFLAAHILLDPGDRVILEEPGYNGAQRAFAMAGAKLVPTPLDAEGLAIHQGAAQAPDARVAFVTPSRHYPLGIMMSLKRRLQLLDWAASQDGWIIEDDYDSEFRYAGRPIPALQGLDTSARVIYIGTFSKVLFPTIRLGYVVVPEDLVGTFVHLRGALDTNTHTLSQVVLADFIQEGHFTRHIRRMRKLYTERSHYFARRFAELIGWSLGPHDAGLSLVAWPPHPIDDLNIARRAHDHGVVVAPVSAYYATHPSQPGLLLGYAGFDETTTEQGLVALRAALADEE